LPLALLAPGVALVWQFPVNALGPLVLSLIPGSLALTALAAALAALTDGLRRGSLLLALLALPLYTPVLIWGSEAARAAAASQATADHILVLIAMGLLSVALAPWAMVAALRLNLEN